MSIWQIIRRLVPFVKPHSRWVALSLGLTLLGAVAARSLNLDKISRTLDAEAAPGLAY
jgi:hypothetical protein